MTARTQPAAHAQAATVERELLARLGLTIHASSQETASTAPTAPVASPVASGD